MGRGVSYQGMRRRKCWKKKGEEEKLKKCLAKRRRFTELQGKKKGVNLRGGVAKGK